MKNKNESQSSNHLWWADIKGYEGLYQVSIDGKVKSLKWGKERILKPGNNGCGYLFVVLNKKGKGKMHKVHRLVAEAFIPNPGNLPQVNHKDENPSNNHVDNLEWMTPSENTNFGTRNERISKANTNGKLFKPVVALDKQGRIAHAFSNPKEAGKHGFRVQSVKDCCRGKLKTHKGLVWKFQDDFLKRVC